MIPQTSYLLNLVALSFSLSFFLQNISLSISLPLYLYSLSLILSFSLSSIYLSLSLSSFFFFSLSLSLDHLCASSLAYVFVIDCESSLVALATDVLQCLYYFILSFETIYT